MNLIQIYCFLYVKDTILKEFTTAGSRFYFIWNCFLYVKDTILKEFTTFTTSILEIQRLFSIRQRYDFKGIHNCNNARMEKEETVFYTSKIRF